MACSLSTSASRVMAARPEGWSICDEGRARAAAGEDVILLATGAPDVAPPAAAAEACARSLASGRAGYPVQQGEAALRAAIAARSAAGQGSLPAIGDVVVTAGAQHGVLACLQAIAGPGDRVAVVTPRYPGHLSAVAAVGAEALPFPLGPSPGHALDPGALPDGPLRAVVISSPHNPCGRVFTPTEHAALAAACRERGAWIVSDEVYAEIAFERGHVPMARSWPEGVFTVGSLSKSHAMPGWRCGWVVAPPGLGEAVQAVVACGSLGVPPFVQAAAAAVLGLPAGPGARAAYAARRDALVGRLSRGRGLRVPYPEGGMFALADVRGLGMNGHAFARLALDAGVCLMPGEAFGAPGHARIALTAPAGRLVEAADRIAGALGSRAGSGIVRAGLLGRGDPEEAACPGSRAR